MSIGYGGYAHLVEADHNLVIYSYCCYNVNLPDYKRFMETEDVLKRVDIFLSTDFMGDKHLRRVNEISDLENRDN